MSTTTGFLVTTLQRIQREARGAKEMDRGNGGAGNGEEGAKGGEEGDERERRGMFIHFAYRRKAGLDGSGSVRVGMTWFATDGLVPETSLCCYHVYRAKGV